MRAAAPELVRSGREGTLPRSGVARSQAIGRVPPPMYPGGMGDVLPGLKAGATAAGGTVWVDVWLTEMREALARESGGAPPSICARIAELLVACGRDEECDAALAEASRLAARSRGAHAIARVVLAHAVSAQVRDDDSRARAYLRTALEGPSPLPPALAARAWLVEARLARVQGRSYPAVAFDLEALDDAADEDDRTVAALVALEGAAIAREAQDWTAASGKLSLSRALIERLGAPRMAALYELEAGQYSADAGDFEQGLRRMRAAVQMLADAGLRRDEGRAMIRYAELVAARPTLAPSESAAAWFGRAQAVLGAAATWRDRLALRTGFRNFGRRVFDRVMSESVLARIDAFERARAGLLSALSLSVETSNRSLLAIELSAETHPQLVAEVERARSGGASNASQAAQAIAEVDRTVHDLIDLIGAALVERARMRVLLDALSEMDAVPQYDALPPLVARVAARLLDADCVVVALERDGELLEFGRHGHLSGAPDAWRSAAGQAMQHRGRTPMSDASQLRTRRDENLFGPVLAVALRGPDVTGAIYADKVRRAGQFREQDYAIAHLLAEYVSLALDRLHAREQERLALHQLAVTLDAIRDGVIACDERGVVTSVNAAAARMLRVRTQDLVGVGLAQQPAVAPLAALLASSPRVDGAFLRLPHGSFVVSSRPIGNDEEPDRGFVTTLVELDRAQKMAQRLSATRARYTFNDIIGRSPALEEAVAMAKHAAKIDASVLVTGESGTGKEVIAQAIHSAGPRASEPFVGINVAALPRELLEAELFGYEKGAFTGARVEGNPGKFELAGEGTILLDEIGDMPLDMQAKLLRVLQERVVTRLGGRVEIPMNARVIATTHRDLDQLVDEGKFRMDLLYRLRVLAIDVPPLRQRREDIAALAQSYLVRFAEQQRKRLRELGPRVIEELERYDWPGNVRELANVMEAEASLAAADVEVLGRLATRLVGRLRGDGSTTGEWRAAPSSQREQPIIPLAEVEKRAFLQALDGMNGNVARAAEALAVSKVTFYAKLRSWGMHPKDLGEDGPPSTRRPTRIPTTDPLAQTDANPGVEAPPASTRSGLAAPASTRPKGRR